MLIFCKWIEAIGGGAFSSGCAVKVACLGAKKELIIFDLNDLIIDGIGCQSGDVDARAGGSCCVVSSVDGPVCLATTAIGIEARDSSGG